LGKYEMTAQEYDRLA